MLSTTNIHPDAVLEALLARSSRSNVKRTLNGLHALCRKHHEAGLRDFSLACVGRKAEEAGLIGYRSLYNPASRVYQDLIKAWAAYAGPPAALPPKTLASYEYLMRIEDPAIRMIMQSVIAERDSLRAQINLIKGNTRGTIDLRPLGPTIVSNPDTGPIAILELSAQLNKVEREALKTAISPNFLEGEGWTEGERGEIRDKRTTRVVFNMGFTSAIRKLLDLEPPKNTMVVS